MFNGKLGNSLASIAVGFSQTAGAVSASSNLTKVTNKDFERIALDYFNRYQLNILPPSRTKCLRIIPDALNSGGVGIVIYKDGVISGMLLAEDAPSVVVDGKILRQSFFNTTLSGMSAAKAVMVSHRVLVDYARAYGYDYVCSNGSNKDVKNHFNKLLEIDGWLTEHYMSVWKINRR